MDYFFILFVEVSLSVYTKKEKCKKSRKNLLDRNFVATFAAEFKLLVKC
jgi:hypothetical protein